MKRARARPDPCPEFRQRLIGGNKGSVKHMQPQIISIRQDIQAFIQKTSAGNP
jgi:hypothetical protein